MFGAFYDTCHTFIFDVSTYDFELNRSRPAYHLVSLITKTLLLFIHSNFSVEAQYVISTHILFVVSNTLEATDMRTADVTVLKQLSNCC